MNNDTMNYHYKNNIDNDKIYKKSRAINNNNIYYNKDDNHI
jgi:hypothetical protein